jgi:hypothetical protein
VVFLRLSRWALKCVASPSLCSPECSGQLAISHLLIGWQSAQNVYCYRWRRLALSVKGRKDVFTGRVRQRPRDGGLELLGHSVAALHRRPPINHRASTITALLSTRRNVIEQELPVNLRAFSPWSR